VFLLGLTHSMSQFVFGIPREYAFPIFHHNQGHDPSVLIFLFLHTKTAASSIASAFTAVIDISRTGD